MIELENVAKHFGDVRAVDGISLTVRPGEFFCVLGPNAAENRDRSENRD